MKLNLFCKPISLNLAIFGKNEGDFREKNYVSVKNYNTHLWILDPSSVNCLWGFSFLPVNWTRSWILLVSWNIWLQISKLTFSGFFHHFHLESLRTEPALFPEALQTEAEQLGINLREIHVCCCVSCKPLRKIPECPMTSSETFHAAKRCFDSDI